MDDSYNKHEHLKKYASYISEGEFIGILKLKEPLIKSRLRLGTHLACIFFVILHRNFLTGDSLPAKFLYNLTKNLTSQYVHQI